MHFQQLADGDGCEAAARLIFDYGRQWLAKGEHAGRVWLAAVEVHEHGANAGTAYENAHELATE
jgi:hypothetical protein